MQQGYQIWAGLAEQATQRQLLSRSLLADHCDDLIKLAFSEHDALRGNCPELSLIKAARICRDCMREEAKA
jgi:hypothetical protein